VLYAWGFRRIGVAASDVYFVDPDPAPGQEGAERGVRVEVRLLQRPPLTGSVYAAQPIVIDRPVWRADLFESVTGPPGSHDRAHHHPHFRGWEPGGRQFDPRLTDDPIGWLAAQLADLPGLLEGAQLDSAVAEPEDAQELADAAGEIAETVARMLTRVRAGELGRAPGSFVDENGHESRTGEVGSPSRDARPIGVRAGWL
jgi:hypothetical protein